MTVLLGLVSTCVGTGITSLQGSIFILDSASCACRSHEVSKQVQKCGCPKARSPHLCNTDQGAHESSDDGYLNNRGPAFLLKGMLTAEV